MKTKIIKADELRTGHIVMLQGYPFKVMGVKPANVSGGDLGNPRPGFAAELWWEGEGTDPGPGYQHWIATQAADNGSWTIRE